MRMKIEDFSFFNKDVKEEVVKLKKLLDDGNILELEMTRSTGCNEALCEIAIYFHDRSGYEYFMSVDRNDKYYSKILVVTLVKPSDRGE